ncbi:MAG: hypothetical protein ACOVPA_20375 [Rubrivivax sp.]
MDSKSRKSFLSQFDKARCDMEKLRKIFPQCFDTQGRAIVAMAAFPRLTKEFKK